MLKKELEYVCERLEKENNELRNQIVEQKKRFEKSLEQTKKEFEDKLYEMWVSQNGKFAEKFFEKMLNEHLSISTYCDYGGNIETKLMYDDYVISSSSDNVITMPDPLEE